MVKLFHPVLLMLDHLVISSAGPNGLIQLGILKQLVLSSILDLSTIKCIYGSSAGSMLGLLITLGAPLQDMVDYFVQRPLDRIFQLNGTDTGLISCSCFEELLTPFFNAYDVPLTLTLQELYDRTHIDLHIFTTAVTPMCSVDLNHETFPDIPVIQAVSMSCAIPFLFTPILYKGEYYIDGGLVKHCPTPPVDPSQVITILMDYKHAMNLESPVQFVQHIMIKLFDIVSSNTKVPEGEFVYRYNSLHNAMDPYYWENVLTNQLFREQLIDHGSQFVRERSNGGDKLPV